MLDREGQGVSVAPQIEVAVAPGVELRGAAQRLTGTDVAGALLGVVDDEHGKRVAALQLAQIGEQRGDLAAGVLVDAVQAHERIENEKLRLQSGNGLLQGDAIGGKIEPECGGGDDLEIEITQAQAGSGLVVHHAKKGAGNIRAGQALRGSSEFHAWGDSNSICGATETP